MPLNRYKWAIFRSNVTGGYVAGQLILCAQLLDISMTESEVDDHVPS